MLCKSITNFHKTIISYFPIVIFFIYFLDCLEVINSPVGKWKVLDGAAVTIADDSLSSIKKKDAPDSKVQVKRKLFAQSDDDDVLEKNAGMMILFTILIIII